MTKEITPKQIRIDNKIPDDLLEKTSRWFHETLYNDPPKVKNNSQALSQYIRFFDSLQLEHGYVVDAIRGLIYTKKQDSKHITSVEEYCDVFGIGSFPSLADDEIYKLSKLDYVQFTRDPLGFYEFAKFCLGAPRGFFLEPDEDFRLPTRRKYTDNSYWLLDSRQSLEMFIETYTVETPIMPDGMVKIVRNLDIRPKIIYQDKLAEVVMLSRISNTSQSSIKLGFVHCFVKQPNVLSDISFEYIFEDFDFFRL